MLIVNYMAYRDADVLERKDTMGVGSSPSYFVRVSPKQALAYLRKPRRNPFSNDGIASLEASLKTIQHMVVLYSPNLEEMWDFPSCVPAIPFVLVPQDLKDYTQARPKVALTLLKILQVIADREDRLTEATRNLISLEYLGNFITFLNSQ